MVLQIYKTAGNGRPELRTLSLCHEILQRSETSRNDGVTADLTMSAASEPTTSALQRHFVWSLTRDALAARSLLKSLMNTRNPESSVILYTPPKPALCNVPDRNRVDHLDLYLLSSCRVSEPRHQRSERSMLTQAGHCVQPAETADAEPA